MKLKNLLKVFGCDFCFFVLIALIFAFLRGKIRGYIGVLGEYNSELGVLDPSKDLVKAGELLQGLTGIANNVALLLIFAVVWVFLIYAVFEGLSFNFANKDKVDDKNRRKFLDYLLKFSIASLPAYILLLLILNYLWINWISILLLLLLGFFGFVFYFKQDKKGFLKLLKNYYLFPGFLLYLLLITFIIGFATLFYLESLIGESNYFFLALAIGFIFLFSLYKYWMVERLI